MALLACIAFIQHQADDEEPLWKMGEKENTIFGIIAMILFCIVGFFGLYLWIRKFLVDYRKLGALSDEGDDDELLGGKESYHITPQGGISVP